MVVRGVQTITWCHLLELLFYLTLILTIIVNTIITFYPRNWNVVYTELDFKGLISKGVISLNSVIDRFIRHSFFSSGAKNYHTLQKSTV